MRRPDADTHAVHVTVIESPGCHFCTEAEAILADLGTTYPLVVGVVDARAPMGQHLIQHHRAAMTPLVLLDEEFFSSGRLPRRKLSKHLQQRFGRAAASKTG